MIGTSGPHFDASGLLPLCLTERLRLDPSAAGLAEHFDAALLFADLSGFTSLAEQLAASGHHGAERLSHVLNLCFGRLVDEIAAHGGDVIRFAGDAPIAVFPTDGATVPIAAAIERAGTCALALQAAMPAIAKDAAHPLAIRTAVSAGPMTLVSVGADHRRDFVVGGPAFDCVARAIQLATPGDVLIDVPPGVTVPSGLDVAGSATAGRIRGSRVTREPSWSAGAQAAPSDQALSFLPPAVVARLQAGLDEWVAELRTLTVLFATLRGVDLTDDSAPDRVRGLFAILQRAIDAGGGAINQFVVDDKGTTCVAAWGLPGQSYDHDPARATLSALGAAAALGAAEVDFGVGLATGRAFCGWRGNRTRREYALVGQTVNLAARLSTLARGRVLCDPATYTGCEGRVRFGTPEPVRVKGLAERVHAATAIGIKTAASPAALIRPLVGRATERAMLRAAVERVQTGRGGAILLQGDPGTGKSSLLAEMTTNARHAGLRVVAADVAPIVRSGAFDVWRDVLTQLLELPDGDTDHRREAMIARLESHADLADRAPLVAELAGVSLPETDLTRQLTGPLRADATREALLTIVHRVTASRPTVLVVDDVQWLDSLSWSAIAAVCWRVPHLLTVLGTRPFVDPPAEWPGLVRHPDTTLVVLDRLSDDEAIALASQEWAVASVPPVLRTLFLEKTAGHPLFAIELARWLRETGVVQVDQGVCRLRGNVDEIATALPGSVEGVILGRLDHLDPAPLLTLKVASVLGSAFTLDGLAAIHPIDRTAAALGAELDACTRAGFVASGAGEREAFVFQHALVHDVAYALIVPTQRAGLHRAAAAWIEGTTPTDQRADAVLAHHWTRGEDFPRAVGYLDRAARATALHGGWRETSRFAQQALELTERHALPIPPLQRAGWQRRVAQAKISLGDSAGAGADLSAAFGLLAYAYPDSPGGFRWRLARETLRQAAHLIRAPRAGGSAEAPDRAHVEEVLTTLRTASDRAFFQADGLAYGTAALALINLAESKARPDLAPYGYASAALLVSLLKLRPLARRWWRQAGEPEAADQRLALLLSRAFVALMEARWEDLSSLIDTQEALARRIASANQVDSALVLRIVGTFQQGRLEESEAAAQELIASAVAQRNDQHELWGRQGTATFLLIRGRVAEAMAEVTRVREIIPEMSDVLTNAQHIGFLVNVALATDAYDEAARLLPTLQTWVQTRPPRSVTTLDPFMEGARCALALWARAQRDSDPASAGVLSRHARRACQDVKGFAQLFPYAAPYHAVLDGACWWLAGRPARARRAWQRALDTAVRNRMPVLEAEAAHHLSRCARPGSDDRARWLDRSQGIVERLGFTRFIVELERWTGQRADTAPSTEVH